MKRRCPAWIARNLGILAMFGGLAVALGPMASPALAGYAEGKAAYEKKDFATAWKELDPLAKQGNADAMFLVGTMYHLGEGVPPSYKDAAEWYRKSADAGKMDAVFTMGVVYEGGIGVPRSLPNAFTWYKKAADRGFHIAQVKLGNMYGKGQGVPKDFSQAYMWFSIAERTAPPESSSKAEIPIVKQKLAELLTKDQIAEAERKAKAWKPAK